MIMIMETREEERNMVVNEYGTVVWNGGCGFSPTQQQFHQNHTSAEAACKRKNGGSFSSSVVHKRIKFWPGCNQKEVDVDSSEQSSPIGLTLKKTPSFLNLIQTELSHVKQNNSLIQTELTHVKQNSSSAGRSRPLTTDTQPMSEKLKASNFPASYLRIGNWERMSKHEGDLIAKCYYAKRKLVWEVLEGALKSKIEIQWTDIVAIRASIKDNEPGILEVEMNQPPLFFRETNPQPRKHTLWQQASDFTGGQAQICRRHYVKFLPGTLDRHYEKLLQYDQRLFLLSQKPFPSHENPFFYGSIDHFKDFNRFGSEFLSALPHPLYNFSDPLILPHHFHNFKPFEPRTELPFAIMASNSPVSVVEFVHMDRRSYNYAALENQNTVLPEGSNHNGALENHSAFLVDDSNKVFDISIRGDPPALVNPVISHQNDQVLSDIEGEMVDFQNQNDGLFNDIEDHLLGPLQEHEQHESVTNDPMILSASKHSSINSEGLHSKPDGLLSREDSDDRVIFHLLNNSSYPYAFSGHAIEYDTNLNSCQETRDWG